jgi:subtilisin family serine protease
MKKLLFWVPILLITLSFKDGNEKELDKIRIDQIRYLQGEEFQRKGISGHGIRIAILDGGFPGVDTHPAFKHLIDNKQIIATWDFVRNRQNVYRGVAHGSEVLSCIAGVLDGKPLGLAPGAEFLLALTEKNGEPLQEELNWVKAVDWAIENGANIIQSSLGYTYQRYFTSDLDGRHSLVAQAAIRAARKGILIINCSGNEGQSKWKTLVTPADADSILSVGAIEPATGLVAGFSSVGPTFDKRIKPNVCAPGKVVAINPKYGARIVQGTSFSAPLITGFAACTWQLNRTLPAQEIIRLIEKSGHLYPYYDYSHGYGIPQASKIINPQQESFQNKLIITTDNENFKVQIPVKSLETPVITPFHYLYYHVSDPSGFLVRYGVYRMENENPVEISKLGFRQGDELRCSFNGVTTIWTESR